MGSTILFKPVISKHCNKLIINITSAPFGTRLIIMHSLNIIDRSKLKMKGKKELSMLLIGLGFFIFDLVSDLYVAVQYKRAGENGWFGLTLTLIIFPFFVINIMATCQMKGRVNCDVRCTGVVCFYIVFARFGEEFKQWKRAYLDTCPCEGNDKECNCTACKDHREAINESTIVCKNFWKMHNFRYFSMTNIAFFPPPPYQC